MARIFSKITNNATAMVWANQLIAVGSSLFVLPLLLKKFDEVEISFWFLITVFLQLTMLADSGFGPSLVRAVSYLKAGAKHLPKNKKEFDRTEGGSGSPNFEKLTDLLITSRKIYNVVSYGAVLLLCTAGVLISWNIYELSGYRSDFAYSYLLIILNSFLILKIVKWNSFMVGLDFVAKVNRFNILVGSARLISFVAILVFVPSIFYLMIFNVLSSIATLIYIRRFVRRWYTKHGCSLRGKNYFDKDLFSTIWLATWKMGGIQWGNYLINYGLSIIIAQVPNVSLMASFLFTQRVIFIFRRISEAPFYANIQKVYGHIARKRFDLFRRMASKYIFLNLVILIGSLSVVGIFGNSVLSFFEIETQLLPTWIFIILSLSMIFEIHAEIHRNIYISTNHIPFLIPIIISGILILVLGFLFLPKFGLISIVLVQLMVQLSFNYWYPLMLSFQLINWNVFTYFRDMYKHGLVGVINDGLNLLKVK